jgi:hypothetical protein
MPTIIDGTDGVSNVDFAEIATGTPDATTFLRGDRTWQPIETTPTTEQVLAATAGASVGAVGTYAWLWSTSGPATAAGSTKAGSNLRYAGLAPNAGNNVNGNTGAWPTTATQVMQMRGAGGTPSGTWRAMGLDGTSTQFFPSYGVTYVAGGMTLWLRIS